MTEAQQRLADVRAAINAILEKGQSVRKDGRELRRADLASLRMLEEQYARAEAAERLARSGARNRINYVKI